MFAHRRVLIQFFSTTFKNLFFCICFMLNLFPCRKFSSLPFYLGYLSLLCNLAFWLSKSLEGAHMPSDVVLSAMIGQSVIEGGLLTCVCSETRESICKRSACCIFKHMQWKFCMPFGPLTLYSYHCLGLPTDLTITLSDSKHYELGSFSNKHTLDGLANFTGVLRVNMKI